MLEPSVPDHPQSLRKGTPLTRLRVTARLLLVLYYTRLIRVDAHALQEGAASDELSPVFDLFEEG